MIEQLKEKAALFADGMLGEKEFLGMIIQVVGEKYTNFPDVENYSDDADVKALASALL